LKGMLCLAINSLVVASSSTEKAATLMPSFASDSDALANAAICSLQNGHQCPR
jgi:hypothetical protein